MILPYFGRMNGHLKNGTKIAFLAVLLIGLFTACEEPDLIGDNILPPGDQPGLLVIDTFTFSARSGQEDSLISSRTESPLFAGTINDPSVGFSQAGFAIQTRIGNTISSSTFNGATAVDSIILVFAWRAVYGDANSTHRFSVYELGESLSTDSSYYSTRSFTKSNLLAHVDFVPAPSDSVVVDSINRSPQLRIALDTAFGGKIVREYLSNPSAFGDNGSWQNYFKGIVIVDSADGNGSIITFESLSSLNRMTLYYQGDRSYDFILDGNVARANSFTHQYISDYTDTLSDATLAVQSMAGLKSLLIIPGLDQLSALGPLSINKAEVSFKVLAGSTSGDYDAHDNLLVFKRDSSGKNALIPDALESSSYYGGSFDLVSQSYRFNIARYIQQIINGTEENNGLFLVAGGSTSNARRTLIDASSLKLTITYTQINP